MIKWYNPLTWSQKTQDNILDKDSGLISQAGAWIGNQDFTEEDRAEHNAAIAKGVTDFAVATLNENTVRSQSRREIAFLWVKAQVYLVFLCVIVAPLDDSLYMKYKELALSDLMTYGTTAVFLFFFGSYGIARFNETKKKG